MKPNTCPSRRSRRGFTLVELLVVIVVIAILIGLLVPAVSAVRTSAKSGATRAIISSLSMGLESFKSEDQLGGRYPPSASDNVSGPPFTSVVEDPRGGGGSPIKISGAGLLVWALSGADFLGTPGFKKVNNESRWANCTSSSYGSGPSDSDLYALDNDGTPVHRRFGPYVDTDKVKTSQWEDIADGGYVVPAEKKADPSWNSNPRIRQYPMYLDAFGYPLLYYRADPAGRVMVDQVDPSTLDPRNRGIYHYMDNELLVQDAKESHDALYLSAGDQDHRMEYEIPPAASGYNPDTMLPNYGKFTRYIIDEKVRAKPMPHNPDTYLLISPGPDGVYGTTDDIANFEHNGTDEDDDG